jgi:RimJ/RimL family protein N-acetyltransferase
VIDMSRSNLSLAYRLPDLPRWIEVRDFLLRGNCEILGLRHDPDLSFVLREPETAAVFVVGTPDVEAIQLAVQPPVVGAEVIAPPERAAWLAQSLPEWTRTRIIVHRLGDHRRLPSGSAGEVSFLDPSTLRQHALPAELLQELESAGEHSLIAAAFVENQPVSFCYAGSLTESLWDVAIYTLEQHRRKGLAARCAAHMIQHMRAQGKQPVWQAVEENQASWRLAQKIGFVPVDELALFEPPEPASSLHS